MWINGRMRSAFSKYSSWHKSTVTVKLKVFRGQRAIPTDPCDPSCFGYPFDHDPLSAPTLAAASSTAPNSASPKPSNKRKTQSTPSHNHCALRQQQLQQPPPLSSIAQHQNIADQKYHFRGAWRSQISWTAPPLILWQSPPPRDGATKTDNDNHWYDSSGMTACRITQHGCWQYSILLQLTDERTWPFSVEHI